MTEFPIAPTHAAPANAHKPADAGAGGPRPPTPHAADSNGEAGRNGHHRRGRRRSIAQREAAVEASLAALTKQKRAARTRGIIVAGTLLAQLSRERKNLAAILGPALHELSARDREALALFMPELS